MMNKQGNTFIVVLMMALLFFFIGLAIAAPLNEVVQEQRDNANCSLTNLTIYQQGGCVIMDLYSPYFIGIIFALGGALIGFIGK